MAARHAGFAVVACVGQDLINNLIEAAFLNYPQQTSVQVPSPLQVGGSTVTIAGLARLLPPVVTLTAGQVRLLVRAEVEARLEGGSNQPLDILVELSSPVTVALTTFVDGDRLQVGVDPASITIPTLTLRVVDGSLPSLYGTALRLPQVAAAVQAAMRALPRSMLVTTVDGFPVTAVIAPRQMPCGASLFELPEMFRADLRVSRVVPVVTESVLVIGVDLAGITSGNPAGLRSLFGDVRPVWLRTDGPEGTIGFDRRSFRGGGNLAVSVNPDALAAALAGPVSAASHHAFVDCHVALDGLSLAPATFTPNLMPQHRIDGLRLGVGARYYLSTGRDAQSRLVPAGDGTPVRVSLPFALHRQTWDGPTAFLSSRRSDSWFLKVYEPDVQLPWWVSFGLVLIGVTLPVFALPVVALLDGIIPSLLGNISDQVRRTAQQGIDGRWREFDFAPTARTFTVPALPLTPVTSADAWYAMDGEGIDVYTSVFVGSRPDTSRDRLLVLTIGGTTVRDGARWQSAAVRTEPISLAVGLKPGSVDPHDRNVRVSWEVRRTDTGDVVLRQDLPRWASLVTTLGGDKVKPMRISIDRRDPVIATMPGFEVSVRVYRPLAGRTKEIGAATVTVEIWDRLDRTRPYVWWSGWAVGSYKESVLHRTATPGRCRMADRAPLRTEYVYLDDLPFPIEQIAQHRDEALLEDRHLKVCDYCFYGGPDKHVLLL